MPPRRVRPALPSTPEEAFGHIKWDRVDERALVFLLLDWARDHPIHERQTLIRACEAISGYLTTHYFGEYCVRKILVKVAHLRSRYIAFQKFLKTPGVEYDECINKVTVHQIYHDQHPNVGI